MPVQVLWMCATNSSSRPDRRDARSGDQQRAEHGGDLLLGAPMLAFPVSAPSPAAVLCHVPFDVARFDRVDEDSVQEFRMNFYGGRTPP
jgi:hypothetical protein